MRRIPSLAALVLTTALSAQTAASVTYYGKGCELSGNTPPLLRTTVPKIGSSFTATYYGPNSVTPVSQDQPFMLLGPNAISVPVPPLSSLQFNLNCTLLVNPLFIVPMPTSGSAWASTYTTTIPNDSKLVGTSIYMQFASVYRNCRSTPCVDQMIRVSNGATLVLGV